MKKDSIIGPNAVIQMDGRVRRNGDIMSVEVAMKFDPATGAIEVIRSDYPELPPGQYERKKS